MAEAMRDIKRRIKTVESTQHITNAMRLVSAAKFRRAKTRYDQAGSRLAAVTAEMERLLQQCCEGLEESAGGVSQPLRAVHQPLRAVLQPVRLGPQQKAAVSGEGSGTVVVLITASRGLCGGYNSGLMKLAAEAIRQRRQMCEGQGRMPSEASPSETGRSEASPSETGRQSVCLYTIGSKGYDFFTRQDCRVIGSFSEAPEHMTADEAKNVTETILKEWREGRAAEVLLVGMRYVNTLKQEGEVRCILPVSAEVPVLAEVPVSAGMPEPETGDEAGAGPKYRRELEFVPSKKAVLEYLLPKYLQLTLYRACLEAAVCEHAARRTAMESAADNAQEMLARLSLNYNRARQQAITDELIEIVSGSEALK